MGSINVLAHNLTSMFSQRQLGINSRTKDKTTEKLASGYRINRAADDASGLSISEKMRFMIRGLKQGLDNTQDGISFIQTADGAMAEAHDMVHRIYELSIKAANGTMSDSDRDDINNEVIQLKEEINKIGKTSKFNEQLIFEQELTLPQFQITGRYFTADDINIYNATYDSVTGKATYGGIIYNGERISFDSIDPDMVSFDDSGNQIFKGGSYSFTQNGETVTIDCQEGDTVPKISRTAKISGDLDHLYLGSKKYSWNAFVDDNGYNLGIANLHSGRFHLKDNENVSIDLDIVQESWNYADLGDIAEAEALGLVKMPDVTWRENWDHAVNITAAKMTGERNADITGRDTITTVLSVMDGSGTSRYRIRAGKEETGDPELSENYSKNGIWLEKYGPMKVYDDEGNVIKDADGNDIIANRWGMVDGSLRTWSQAGLDDEGTAIWTSGRDISDAADTRINYDYTDPAGSTAGFTFVLDTRVTSLDSVIDLMDRADLYSKSIKTSYSAGMTNTDPHILKSSIRTNGDSSSLMTVKEEYAFQRDYSAKTRDSVVTAQGTLNGSTADLSMSNGYTTESISYSGTTASQAAVMVSDMKDYASYVLDAKIKAALKGLDPQAEDNMLTPKDLREVVGDSNIYSSDNKMTYDFMLRNDMEVTDWVSPARIPGTFAGACIDFKDVTNIRDLAGAGFDSTCATCSNHYSIVFTTGDSDGYDYINDDNGKQLKFDLSSSGNHYLMNIDLDSLVLAGYTRDNLASAIVKLASGHSSQMDPQKTGLDFHYTQYAADGTKLYAFDNRNYTQNDLDMVHSHADFYTKPYEAFFPATSGNYSYDLSTSDGSGRSMTLSYSYDFSDLKDNIIVNMKEDPSGDYVRNDKGDGTFNYIEYKAPVPVPDGYIEPQRYSISVAYSKNGSDYSDAEGLLEAYSAQAQENMIEKSTVNFNATDYTKVNWAYDPNNSQALDSRFISEISSLGNSNDGTVYIQHSSEITDHTAIPKFTLNTFCLGIFRADCSTQEKATLTIDRTKKALMGISRRRSVYGAYQNRLEHTYANHANTHENITASESRIRDTDMSLQMQKYANENIIQQAGEAMLSQANQQPQQLLRLLGQ